PHASIGSSGADCAAEVPRSVRLDAYELDPARQPALDADGRLAAAKLRGNQGNQLLVRLAFDRCRLELGQPRAIPDWPQAALPTARLHPDFDDHGPRTHAQASAPPLRRASPAVVRATRTMIAAACCICASGMAGAASMALIGSVEKYAAGPLRSTGTSMGCAPALSGMRASITLMATRSSEMPARPPARPKAMASRGRATRKVRRKAGSAAPNSVGNSTATTRCPAMRLPSSARTACQDGFSASPSNGVKPVSRTVGNGFVIGSEPE